MVKSYLVVQFKRLIRVLPMAVLFNFIAVAGICSIFLLAYNLNKDDGRASVGVVGDFENRYMKFGVGMLNSSSKFSIRFESMSEDEAKSALRNGEIVGYFRIDKDFIDGLEQGENRPISYVSSATGGVISELSREVASVFAVLIVNSERAVYAADDYLREHPGIYDRNNANFELNIELINTVLGRGRIYKQSEASSNKDISEIAQIMSGILILIMLLSGVGMGGFLAGNKNAMLKLLKSRGVGDIASIGCELLATIVNVIISTTVFIMLFMIAKRFFSFRASFISLEFFFSLIIIVIMFSAMHIFIYELITSRVAAVLIEILLGISFGYIGGCIYPVSFFPKLVQIISNFLPSGAGIRLIFGSMGYNMGLLPPAIILIYTALFLGGAYALRHKK